MLGVRAVGTQARGARRAAAPVSPRCPSAPGCTSCGPRGRVLPRRNLRWSGMCFDVLGASAARVLGRAAVVWARSRGTLGRQTSRSFNRNYSVSSEKVSFESLEGPGVFPPEAGSPLAPGQRAEPREQGVPAVCLRVPHGRRWLGYRWGPFPCGATAAPPAQPLPGCVLPRPQGSGRRGSREPVGPVSDSGSAGALASATLSVEARP